jgi:hypothetical protein
MNTNRKHSSKLLWLSGLVLVLVAGTAMAGDHHRGVRVYGGFGYYGAPAVVYSDYPVYPVYPACPPTVVYSYSQPYYVQPYYAPSVVVGGYWGGSGYYAAPWGHYGYSRHHR